MANELSRKLSQPDYLGVTPITVFTNPETGGGESPWQ
jgi:hypothetical protein